MPKLTRPKQKQREALRKQAHSLYEQGVSFRKIGGQLGISHTWAYELIQEYEQDVLNKSFCCGAEITDGGRCSACQEGVK